VFGEQRYAEECRVFSAGVAGNGLRRAGERGQPDGVKAKNGLALAADQLKRASILTEEDFRPVTARRRAPNTANQERTKNRLAIFASPCIDGLISITLLAQFGPGVFSEEC
jgi:hypothetical protein